MTVVVYRDGILAGDNCSWSDGIRRKSTKVFRFYSWGELHLVGFTGQEGYCRQVLNWLQEKEAKPVYLDKDTEHYQCALLVRNGVIYTLNNALDLIPTDEEYFAIGAGQEIAWGALHAGATAEEAVMIVQHRSNYAAFGATKVSIHE